MSHRIPLLLCLAALFTANLSAQAGQPALKEWSFLIFLNGHNNLDSYGAKNIEDMEKVGSTDQVNIVVQWASMAASTTKRLYIKKSSNPNAVTSPTVNDPGLVDMGDYNSLVDFVKWGAQNYPAKHYFVAVWDHGGGWHSINAPIKPNDISWDDRSGHFITTKQLGQAMGDISKILGQKIDVYGSDACLMAMGEVANEMRDSVAYYVGSEETEPGDGWPYQPFLAGWTKTPTMAPADVAKLLSREYVKAYSKGGVYSPSEVTMSAFDLSKLADFNASIKALGAELESGMTANKTKILAAANATQSYAYPDYKDVVDFTNHLQSSGIVRDVSVIKAAQAAVSALVIENHDTATYANSHGVSIWIPSTPDDYSTYRANYTDLVFNQDTAWGNVIDSLDK